MGNKLKIFSLCLIIGVNQFAGVVVARSAEFQNPNLVKISSDPYTDSLGQHETEVEPDAYAFDSTIVSAFQVGRNFYGGGSNIGWATSQDSGQTWKKGFLPGITKVASGPFDTVSDASVTYDAAHDSWIISSLPLLLTRDDEDSGLLISRSTDGGLSWQDPINTHLGARLDKNWVRCDNNRSSRFFGRCYMVYDDPNGLILLVSSNDGGLTWSNPIFSPDSVSGEGVEIGIQPNGTLIVTMGGFSDDSIKEIISSDGGTTFGKSNFISTGSFKVIPGFRSPVLPSTSVDADGVIYTVWSDCRFETHCTSNDVVLIKSNDGQNWSQLMRLPLHLIGSGSDHFNPVISLDPTSRSPNARLFVTYYYLLDNKCKDEACEIHIASTFSNDGGLHWTPPMELADPMKPDWIPPTSQGLMLGDYFGSVFVQGQAFPFVTVAKPKNGKNFDQAIYTLKGGLTVGNSHDDVITMPSELWSEDLSKK